VIAVAEACSWSAVVTTNYLGNVLENSHWTAAFLLIAMALLRLLPRFRGDPGRDSRGGRIRRFHGHGGRANAANSHLAHRRPSSLPAAR
jgi:hypothetical protein